MKWLTVSFGVDQSVLWHIIAREITNPLRKRHGGPQLSCLFCDYDMGIFGCSSCLTGLFLSLLDSHFRNTLTSAPGPTLTLGFPKQTRFLVTSHAGFVFLVPCGTWFFFLLVI